jgi:peptidylprolyl isomerase
MARNHKEEELMAQVKQGDTVKVHYTGKLEDGTVFDSSQDREPLQFTVGQGQIIPGFEEPIVGMNPGEAKTITAPAEKAYGPRRDEMVVVVDRDQFPPDIEPEVGERLQLRQPDGTSVVVTIADVSDAEVTLDANHPLAGKDLIFDVEVVEIV